MTLDSYDRCSRLVVVLSIHSTANTLDDAVREIDYFGGDEVILVDHGSQYGMVALTDGVGHVRP